MFGNQACRAFFGKYRPKKVKPGFFAKFLRKIAKYSQKVAKTGKIWANSSSQKIPGLMSYPYPSRDFSNCEPITWLLK